MHHLQVGDGTNFLITFAGELLNQAEELLQMGLHPSEIIAGYEKACDKALAEIEGSYMAGINDFQFSRAWHWSSYSI